jgi:hypothetical protein
VQGYATGRASGGAVLFLVEKLQFQLLSDNDRLGYLLQPAALQERREAVMSLLSYSGLQLQVCRFLKATLPNSKPCLGNVAKLDRSVQTQSGGHADFLKRALTK